MITAALDIETDTSPLTAEEKAAGYTSRGLDPRITQITAVAIAIDGRTVVLDEGDEEQIIRETLFMLEKINPTIIATWNGSVFDLPFIQDRAALYGLETGLELTPNPDIVPKYQPTPGHEGGYDAFWGAATHIDTAYIFKDQAEQSGVKWSLKPFAKSVGLEPVEVDRERMHELAREELEAYVASDAEVTLALAKKALRL